MRMDGWITASRQESTIAVFFAARESAYCRFSCSGRDAWYTREYPFGTPSQGRVVYYDKIRRAAPVDVRVSRAPRPGGLPCHAMPCSSCAFGARLGCSSNAHRCCCALGVIRCHEAVKE